MDSQGHYDPDNATRYYPCGEVRYVVHEAYSGTTTLHRQRPHRGAKQLKWVRDREFAMMMFDTSADADAEAKRLAARP
jgi:hypothetical protein